MFSHRGRALTGTKSQHDVQVIGARPRHHHDPCHIGMFVLPFTMTIASPLEEHKLPFGPMVLDSDTSKFLDKTDVT